MKQAIFPFSSRFLFLLALAGLLLAACGPSDPKAPPTQAGAAESASAAPAEQPTATEPAAAAGMDVYHPAPRGETVSSADFEFTVLEVLRGQEALAILKAASSFNGPPEDPAMEYVLVRTRVRYVGDSADGLSVDLAFFDSAGSDGTLYDRPSILDVRDPAPYVQADLTPGGEVEGWVTVLARIDDPAPILVVQPRINGLSTGPADLRYLSLAE